MKYATAKAIGLNTDQKASLVNISSKDDDLFLAVLCLSCDDAFTTGRQLLADLSDSYFGEEGTPSDKLKSAFSQIKEKLASCSRFDILLSATSGKVLYLISEGAVSGYLRRFDKLSPLLDPATSGQLISGFLQEGDRVFLSTQSLVEFLKDELTPSLELPLKAWEEEIGEKVTSSRLIDSSAPAPELETHPKDLAGLILDVEGEPVGVEEEMVGIPAVSAEEQPRLETQVQSFSSIITKLEQTLVFIRRFSPAGGRPKLILAVILILIVASGATVKFINTKNQEKNAKFAAALQQAKDNYNAALGLQTLNPGEANQKLSSAKDNLNAALKLKRNDKEANEFKKKLEESSSSISGQFKSDFSLFLDLDLIKNGFQAQRLSLSVGKLAILDPSSKTLVTVDLAKKSHQILAGKDQLGDATFPSINGDLVFVFSKDKGVLRVDTGNQKVTVVSKVDEGWGEIVDLAGFASNVYLLDSKGNQIWKYVAGTEGYSDKRAYLEKDTKVNFAGALRMQIESSIYILKTGGEILRFTKGAADFFSIGGLDKGIKDPKSIFTSSDTDNLSILDSGNSRLVILSKVGAYKAQYGGDKFGTASDLVVDEKGKKVYLLEGSKIWQMDLK